ncbi:hypothetical protein QFC19_006722 [Naganishia cerealis]|uniref:Uncharacterized protein n=1 Tax=Naganishia cerealis TaxID=610337 RepID=A0ACC2VES2_9TREE|nr:hypothetical protein QFC19_006722 [Naganishia cerealis]
MTDKLGVLSDAHGIRCEMTENLLSSLDTKIAQARAETIATKAFAEQQKQDRFNSYHAFSSMGTAKSRKGDKQQQPSRPVKEQPSRMSELDAVLSGTSRNTRSHARRTHVSDGIPDSSVPSEAMSRPAEGDGVNSDIDGSANASRVRL